MIDLKEANAFVTGIFDAVKADNDLRSRMDLSRVQHILDRFRQKGEPERIAKDHRSIAEGDKHNPDNQLLSLMVMGLAGKMDAKVAETHRAFVAGIAHNDEKPTHMIAANKILTGWGYPRNANAFIAEILVAMKTDVETKKVRTEMHEEVLARLDLNQVNSVRQFYRAPESESEAAAFMVRHLAGVKNDPDPVNKMVSIVMLGAIGQEKPELAKRYMGDITEIAKQDTILGRVAKIIKEDWEDPVSPSKPIHEDFGINVVPPRPSAKGPFSMFSRDDTDGPDF